tara:strand:- start:1058 stop:1750 length:693 start_codon:yes stop_codon:yes gene_type:complete
MKVVILAGGKGTRLSEYTKTIPKPMTKIHKFPIIIYIMKHYAKYGFKDFIIATGYKKNVIEKYFKRKFFDWNIKLVNTGKETMTGGRIKRLKKIIKNETFMLTYGDGLSDVNLKKLLLFHYKNRATVTLTAVRPPARFGAISLKGNKVTVFREKSSLDSGWINGGFFVMEPEIFKFIKNDKTFLEREPMSKLDSKKKLFAFRHYKFWQCMDTKRDKEILEKLIKKYKKKF